MFDPLSLDLEILFTHSLLTISRCFDIRIRVLINLNFSYVRPLKDARSLPKICFPNS